MNFQQILFSGIIAFCLSSTLLHSGSLQELRGKSFLQSRSVGTNAARELVGWRQYINNRHNTCTFGAFAITPAYAHTYRPSRIAEYFFGSDTIIVSGSQVLNRDTNHILADYFGLSPVFFSKVELKPKLKNGIFDMSFYASYKSLYLRAHAPLNWASSIIELNELVSNDGSTTPFPALYMDTVPTPIPAHSFSRAIHGNVSFGQLTEGLASAIISPCAQHTFHVADVHVAGGWNFIDRDLSHAGINLRFVAPTGNRPTGKFLFEPIAGNGHHWEVGAGFTGHIVIWEYGTDRSISLYSDLNITHLCAARQKRCFDICVGCCKKKQAKIIDNFASRYILAKQFDLAGNYTGSLVPLANRTTLECRVKTGLQFDFVFMAGYTGPQFAWDIGYNGWLRTKESIKITQAIKENSLGLKGLQNVANNSGLINTTQSQATINGNNAGDNNAGLLANQATLADPQSPVFLRNDDIDRKSAANPRSFTHKIFAHIDYHKINLSWRYLDTCFVGIGGEVEFESAHRRSLSKPNKNSLSQWSLWLKTGITI
jgi:hypothetical protein